MNPKIARDPYLGPVVERWGEQAALDAGWFDDGDHDDAPLDDVDWLCTPVDVVQRGARGFGATGDAAPVVLLSTGGFFPVHRGHVAMMNAARRHVDGDGDEPRVVAGYLSPGHDDYIRLKCGAVDVPVSDRLVLAESAVAGTGWLSIDPWEAQARRVAVNFTDVTARLEAYLRHHVHPRIEVVYVCGGDNARFALAFAERGSCVVVGRPGCETTVERWRTDARIAGNPRIGWVDGGDPSSSSAIRTSRPAGLEQRAGRTGSAPPARSVGPGRLTLRLEDEQAVATLGLPVRTWRRFQAELQDELASRVVLATVTVEDQRLAATVARTISLDPMLPAEIDLGISRRFDLGGLRPLGHVARPGAASIDEQLAAVPAGTWALRDDDRSTGSTVRFVADLLPDGVSLAGTEFALDTDAEIADSRDFLLGTDDGGLVVALPGPCTGRAPYLLPYVDPSVRVGLPGSDAVAFSAAIWARNASAFASTDLTVDDLPPASARTMLAAGHRRETPLVDVCRWHVAVLRTWCASGRPPAAG